MFTKLRKFETNESGFTLIELLVVILIIGILAAVAIPVFLNQQKAAVDARTKSDMRTAKIAMQTYLTEHGPTEVVKNLGLNASERTIFSTEGTLSNVPNPSQPATIVEGVPLQLNLSEGTRMRVYDRNPATGQGFQDGVFYVQAWNPNGKEFTSYATRTYWDSATGTTQCAAKTNQVC